MAKALGTPLLPWQRYTLDVALERRADGSYQYQVVVVTVPRQSGKTTLIRALGVHGCLMCRSTFYTAQTGKDARARWADLVKVLRLSPAFAAKVKSGEIKIALRGGSEHVEFPGGAVFQAFAPTVESLHGYTPPRVVVDEAFAQSAENGELLMGAIEPAQRTIVDKQIWLVSTRGTAESTFFHDWIDRARNGTDRVALFDWGAADHHDPFSLDDIPLFHPAVGFEFREIGQTEGLITTAESILAAAEKMSRAEYVRAYANRATATSTQIITTEEFRGLADDALEPPADLRDVTLAYDVDEHSAAAAIVAVWDVDGVPAARLVYAAPGSSWLADKIADLDQSWRPARIVAAGNGPVLDVTADLVDRGVDVAVLTEREFAIATSELVTGVRDRAFVVAVDQVVDDQVVPVPDRLEASATGLATRSSVVDGVAFSRRHSAGSSAAGIALAVALHKHRHARSSAPVVRFAS